MNTVRDDLFIRRCPVGFVYLLRVNSHFKIGHTRNVEGVLNCARRFDAATTLVSCWIIADSRQAESVIHAGLKRYRLAREQFSLPEDVVSWMASLDDREFGGWLEDTGCDARAIGWDFPRVFSPSGMRFWRCLYFPSSDHVAWALVARETKPDYSMLESLWNANSKGFNSVWLGCPKKYTGMASYSI